jgi:carboxypeptidase Taq
MPDTSKQLYNSYVELLQKAADFNYASAVLGWDMETYMPLKGVTARSRQLATLASQAHELVTSETYANLLAALKGKSDLSETEQWNVIRSTEDYEKNKKLSAAFVEELSKQTSECFTAWTDARKKNDFNVFAGPLDRMIVLKKQQAELYGYEAHPYDALLDEYEKGATVAMLEPIFKGIREDMPPILEKIKNARQVNDDFMYRNFPKQQQWDFSMAVLVQMHYDFAAGRQDYSEHPFTTSFSSSDVRITTRVSENNYASLLWSTIHEGGHALYEQGLPDDQYGLPLGSPTSLSIHESQSRFWENCVGRGMDFWRYFYPRLQQYFPSQLSDITVEEFFKAVNKVEPSLIRTEADEVTYHFHVMIRYEIEKALMEGLIKTKDLPATWNELYYKYLGIKPADDKTGVLQDVHWSHGSFGYFPTYTLGSFYAAQFFNKANEHIKDLGKQIARGELKEMLDWLRKKVHIHGRRFTSEELCEKITGQKLDPSFFTRYIKEKYALVYDQK